MAKKKREGTLSGILLGLTLLLFIFSASVILVLNCRWLYDLDLALLKIGRTSGMSDAQMRINYDILIRYNQFWFRGPLVFQGLPMSETARIHFAEVKRIFDVLWYMAMITGVLSVAGLIRKRKTKQSFYWLIAGIGGIALPLTIAILAAVNWDWFFVLFHRILFRNNYWLFNPATDPVILMLPDAFFLHCAIAIILLILCACVGCILLGRHKKKRNNRRRQR